MINNLINIKIRENEQVVSGRTLHEFLDIKDNYTDWFKRMHEYGFTENIDFILLSEKSDKRGRPKIEHILKLDMAKEIAMIQRSEKGKQARQYFIECEKRFKKNKLENKMSDDEILLKAVMIANNRIEEQSKKILELEVKNKYLDIILADNKGLNITQIAQDYGYSAKKMNEILKELNIQYKNNQQWIIKAKYKDKGYVVSETFTIEASTPMIKMNTKWTQKGREFLYHILKKNNILPIIEKYPN